MPIPTAATTQIVAAVVIPLILLSPLKITPAPKKPIPETILDAILSGLFGAPIHFEMIVKNKHQEKS